MAGKVAQIADEVNGNGHRGVLSWRLIAGGSITLITLVVTYLGATVIQNGKDIVELRTTQRIILSGAAQQADLRVEMAGVRTNLENISAQIEEIKRVLEKKADREDHQYRGRTP